MWYRIRKLTNVSSWLKVLIQDDKHQWQCKSTQQIVLECSQLITEWLKKCKDLRKQGQLDIQNFQGTTVTKGMAQDRNVVSQLKKQCLKAEKKDNQNEKWQKWIMQGWQKWRGGQDAAPWHCKPATGSSIIMVIFLWPPPLHTEKKKRENRVEAENISPSSTTTAPN